MHSVDIAVAVRDGASGCEIGAGSIVGVCRRQLHVVISAVDVVTERERAGAVEVPLDGDDGAGPGWGSGRDLEGDCLACGDVGARTAVGRDVQDGLDPTARRCRVGQNHPAVVVLVVGTLRFGPLFYPG